MTTTKFVGGIMTANMLISSILLTEEANRLTCFDTLIHSSPFITLYLRYIQMNCIISESCYYFIFVFVALRPKSTAMVIAGWSVHLTTLFSRASLNKQLTSNRAHTFACN